MLLAPFSIGLTLKLRPGIFQYIMKFASLMPSSEKNMTWQNKSTSGPQRNPQAQSCFSCYFVCSERCVQSFHNMFLASRKHIRTFSQISSPSHYLAQRQFCQLMNVFWGVKLRTFCASLCHCSCDITNITHTTNTHDLQLLFADTGAYLSMQMEFMYFFRNCNLENIFSENENMITLKL